MRRAAFPKHGRAAQAAPGFPLQQIRDAGLGSGGSMSAPVKAGLHLVKHFPRHQRIGAWHDLSLIDILPYIGGHT
nr:hypothetical protein [uncultured Bilophila sp.]